MDVIKIEDIHKKFRIYHDKGSTLKEKLLFRGRTHYAERWVLRGINLNIKKGETVGLIGENGSGKSTLLKLMTRIIYPDRGKIEVLGKVSSLLELGAGFHPDMTGRENIYMNASIFGLSKLEIDKKMADIIDFSELRPFIDNPVRTYSSGMYMRLAFSVAINVDPEILLIDEILAVGDTTFQKKCFDKIMELKGLGKTIVIVSHDNNNIKKLCDKVVWLNNGEINYEGESDYIVDKYIEYMYKRRKNEEELYKNPPELEKTKEEIHVVNQNEAEDEEKKDDEKKKNGKEKEEDIEKAEEQNSKEYLNEEQKKKNITPARWGTKEIEFTKIEFLNANGEEQMSFKYGEKLTINMRYKCNESVKNPVFGFGLFLPDGTRCYGTNTMLDNLRILEIKKAQEGVIKFQINNLYLINGVYHINLGVHTEDGYIFDYLNRMYNINVYSSSMDIGIFKPEHKWERLNL